MPVVPRSGEQLAEQLGVDGDGGGAVGGWLRAHQLIDMACAGVLALALWMRARRPAANPSLAGPQHPETG